MIRTDVQLKKRQASTTILTKQNQFTFATENKDVTLFSSAKLTHPMICDLENSKVITILSQKDAKGFWYTQIRKNFGFSSEAFSGLLVFVIEKYEL